jgi:hypothetical protein
LDAAFDGDPVADDHVVFNERVIADIAVPADAGARKDVCVGPDPRSFANVIGIDQSSLMKPRIPH